MRSGLIARLRERGVLRVAASYAVIAWLVLQIADVVLEPWDLPAWVQRAPLVVALLGFPIAVALAWFLELGDGAVTRDAAADGVARPVVHGWRRHVDIAVISVLGAIVGFFLMRDAGWLGESARPGRGVESSSLAVLPFANAGAYGDQHVSEGLERRAAQPVLAHAEPAGYRAFLVDRLRGPVARRRRRSPASSPSPHCSRARSAAAAGACRFPCS